MIPVFWLKYLIRKLASRETAMPPADLWSQENPFYGHCAVAAALCEDFCGGTTKRGVIPAEWQEKLGFKSHYWNILPDGSDCDLSKEQFPPDFPYEEFVQGKVGSEFSTDVRTRILANDDTRKRYELLRERVRAFLNGNPIFSDSKYRLCWELALSEKSKCPKMRFACLVYRGGRLIVKGVNRLMTEQFGKERLCSLDGSRCIRRELPHRADPAIGDCGHAPVWCLRQVFDLGFRPSDLPKLDFYEAGFYPDGSPWFSKRQEYTCIGCQNTFALLGLDKISIPMTSGWVVCLTRDSFYASADYALGKEKV